MNTDGVSFTPVASPTRIPRYLGRHHEQVEDDESSQDQVDLTEDEVTDQRLESQAPYRNDGCGHPVEAQTPGDHDEENSVSQE